MQRRQAYKYELRPTGEQQRLMRRFAGSCRFVFNKALAAQRARYEQGEQKLGYAGLCKTLTGWRNDAATAWLSESPIHPLQQSLKDLERAYRNFFEKRADFPRMKKKGVSDSFRYPDPKQITLDQANNRIRLPKLGWLRYRNSREALGKVKNVTVSLSGGKWFVSIQTEREVEVPLPKGGELGIDVGIARFATFDRPLPEFDHKDHIAPLNSFRRHEARLRRAQRALSRKVKYSRNWRKAKARVQRLHSTIAHVRRDYLHKTTHTLSQNHAVVYVEDLQVRNMSKTARGTVENPGRNVKAKSGLNKAILDQGWFEFRRQLDYKLAWNGGHLIAVPPQYTSQTCPCCRHVSRNNRQTQAKFECVECGYANNADVVGAINLRAAGQAVLACGGTVQSDRPVKQEPAEANLGGALCAA